MTNINKLISSVVGKKLEESNSALDKILKSKMFDKINTLKESKIYQELLEAEFKPIKLFDKNGVHLHTISAGEGGMYNIQNHVNGHKASMNAKDTVELMKHIRKAHNGIQMKESLDLDESYHVYDNKGESISEDYDPKNPKIDIYHKGEYKASTKFSPTLKHAKLGWLDKHPDHKPDDIKCYFDKR